MYYSYYLMLSLIRMVHFCSAVTNGCENISASTEKDALLFHSIGYKIKDKN